MLSIYIDMASLTVVMASHNQCVNVTHPSIMTKDSRRSSAIWVCASSGLVFPELEDELQKVLRLRRTFSSSGFALAAGKSSMAVAPSLSLLLATTLVSLVSCTNYASKDS